MPLKITNSQSKHKEVFVPLEPPRVGLYVCGVTVYDSCHIGHARSMIAFDVLVRFLRHKGYQVTYVRNFTDIDDKIIARAQKEGLEPHTLAESYIEEFGEDMKALGVLPPDVEPRATDHIPDILILIRKLLDQGAAYVVDGDVFFAVEKFKSYGILSNRSLEEMQAGARIEVDPRKHHPMDFALWKKGKSGDPVWESPWGPGRPGWHIECSAMSSRYLGETFDLHGGGKDLIFPHHENELAQSMAISGKPLARYWVHNGFVTIQGEKMSKSLGNFLTIREMVRRFHPEAIRLFLLSCHYRSPLDYTDQAMQDAQGGLQRLYSLLLDLQNPKARPQSKGGEKVRPEQVREAEEAVKNFREKCEEALEDDFNTAQAIGYFFDLAKQLNRLMDRLKAQEMDLLAHPFQLAVQSLRQYGEILGILTLPPESYFSQEKGRLLAKKGLSPERVENLILERNQARQEKDWSRADALRDQLKEMAVILKDTPRGTLWWVQE